MEKSLGLVQTVIELNNAVVFQKTRIESFLHGIESDLSFLHTTPPVQGILRARANGNVDPMDGSTLETWSRRLEVIFTGFMQVKTFFRCISFVDSEGKVLVSVESDGRRISSKSNTQGPNHAEQECFRGAIRLGKGDLFVSDVSLLPRNGVGGHIPVLQLAIPVFGEAGRRQGVLVMEVLANHFLADLRRENGGVEFFLADKQGNYLVHKDPAKEYGKLLGKAGAELKSDSARGFAASRSSASGTGADRTTVAESWLSLLGSQSRSTIGRPTSRSTRT